MKFAENTAKSVQMIGVRDSRGPCIRIVGECCQISLWKWSLGSNQILYEKDGHKRETICPHIKWDSALFFCAVILKGTGC